MVTCSRCGAAVVGHGNFCVKCGNQFRPASHTPGAAYCARCGQILPGVSLGITGEAIEEPGIPQTYASPICYLFGFASGLVMFFMDKRRLVRFHAAQSTIVFGLLVAGILVVGRLARDAFVDGQQAIYLAYFVGFSALSLAALALWIILIVKAFERKPLRLPIVGRIAEWAAGGRVA